jgi:hypothetical protein
MIFLGIILIILGVVFFPVLIYIGVIVLVLGLIFMFVGFGGREIGGRRHWY